MTDPAPTPPADPARRRPRRLLLKGIVVVALGISSAVLGSGALSHGEGADAACTISTSVRLGARNDAARCVQSTLAAAGYNPGPVDGWFGSQTRNAVIAYQRAGGLFVDGVVGPRTGAAMGIWGAMTSPATPSPAPSPAPSTGGCSFAVSLRVGASGDAVRCLQRSLAGAGFSPGPVDGGFGNMTRSAVVAFQRSRGLFVDGVAGRQTGTALGVWGAPSAAAPGPATVPAPSADCAPPAGVPDGARQVVVVNSAGTTADVDLLVRTGAGWTCARMDMSGRVGRNGVRAIAARRSGDGTTPAGVFGLGTMTAPDGQTFQFFGNGANPGVPGAWRQIRGGDCWDATPGSPTYNTLVSRASGACTGEDEYLPEYVNSYSAAALIGANMGPNRSGDQAGEPALAAAIFLHRHTYDAAGNARPTAGCVSLGAENLAAVLRTLVPGETYFVIR